MRQKQNFLTPEHIEKIKSFKEKSTITGMCKELFGENYTNAEYTKVYNFCKRNKVKCIIKKRKFFQRIHKINNVVEQSSFKRPPAVYSNPNWQSMYL